MNLLEYFQNKFGTAGTDTAVNTANTKDMHILFDSHCHLTWFEDDQRGQVVNESVKAGVTKIIDIAVDLQTSKITLSNAKKFPGIVYPTAGIDPEIVIPGSELFIENLTAEKILTELEDFIKENHRELIMIGECGLDYYWIYKNDLSEEEVEKSKKLQKQIFARQIELAAKYNLPLSIHHRDSLEDCLKMLAELGAPSTPPKVKAVFHSFTGDIKDAQKIINQGFAIGINGIVTYQSADGLRTAVNKLLTGQTVRTPRDLYQRNIFLETDSPFLPPRGSKNNTNVPSNIRIIADYLRKIS